MGSLVESYTDPIVPAHILHCNVLKNIGEINFILSTQEDKFCISKQPCNVVFYHDL